MAAFFPVLHLAFGPAVACAAAAAFLAQGKPKVRGADGALREDHLLWSNRDAGTPTMPKSRARKKASVLLVASSMFGLTAASHRCFVCALHSSSSVAHNLREPQQPLLDRRVTLGVGPH